MVIVKQGRVNNVLVKIMTSRNCKITEGNVIHFPSSESQSIFLDRK